MAACVAEVVWLLGLLQDLGVSVPRIVSLHYDSKVAIQIAANPTFHERTKHIDIDCHFVREKVKEGMIQTTYLATQSQIADMLTKGLGVSQHHLLLSKLGVLNIFHREYWNVYEQK